MDELDTNQSPQETPSARPPQAARQDAADDDMDRPVTLRELRAAQEDLGLRARRAQSAADRSEQRILQRLGQDLRGVEPLAQELKEIGVELSPEQTERLRQRRLYTSLSQAPEDEPAPQRGRQPDNGRRSEPEEPPQFNPVAATADAAWAIMTGEYGVVVNEGDPEFAMIDLTTSKPSVLLGSVRDAAEAKARRVGKLADDSRDTQEPLPAPPRETTRARTGGGRKPPVPNTFEGRAAMDLFKEAYGKTTPR